MGPEFIDQMAVALATAASRRQAVKGLAAGVLGGVGSFLGHEPSRAQACKANGKACKKNDQCCSKNCVGGTGSGSTAHSEGVCQPGTGCGGSTTLCGTDCVDLTTDAANCGRCGNPCISGACQNGECCTTGTCGSLTCPARADICTGPGLSCGNGSVSCYCHKVPDGAGGTTSVCGSRTPCFDNLQDCNPGDPCNYNGTNDGICISCGGCISCFKPCSV